MAQAVFAVRFEMARTLEDVLSRRTRALLLDERAALRAAPAVVERMRRELGQNDAWRARELNLFSALVESNYRSSPVSK